MLPSESRRRRSGLGIARGDLFFQAALVASLWVILDLLGAELTQIVVAVTVAAVFGPDALKVGLERLSSRDLE